MLLGIELDTVSEELRIDPTRLAEIFDLLDAWSTKRHCTKRQLQSLLASLTLFSLCATPGERSYILCWMSSAKLTIRPHHLRWNHAFHKDAFWWRNFLPSWKGRSFFYDDKWTPSSHFDLYTDACQSGFGAYFAGDRLYGSSPDHDVPCPVWLRSRNSLPLPLPSTLGQHPLLVVIFCSIAIT